MYSIVSVCCLIIVFSTPDHRVIRASHDRVWLQSKTKCVGQTRIQNWKSNIKITERGKIETLTLFVCAWWCPTHIVLCFYIVFSRLVYLVLPVALNCSCLIAPSLSSNIYLHKYMTAHFPFLIHTLQEEEFADTKGVIIIRKSKKNRQHNGQMRKDRRTNNDLQNIHIKLKIE